LLHGSQTIRENRKRLLELGFQQVALKAVLLTHRAAFGRCNLLKVTLHDRVKRDQAVLISAERRCGVAQDNRLHLGAPLDRTLLGRESPRTRWVSLAPDLRKPASPALCNRRQLKAPLQSELHQERRPKAFQAIGGPKRSGGFA
jgi:hypothetical protein